RENPMRGYGAIVPKRAAVSPTKLGWMSAPVSSSREQPGARGERSVDVAEMVRDLALDPRRERRAGLAQAADGELQHQRQHRQQKTRPKARSMPDQPMRPLTRSHGIRWFSRRSLPLEEALQLVRAAGVAQLPERL